MDKRLVGFYFRHMVDLIIWVLSLRRNDHAAATMGKRLVRLYFGSLDVLIKDNILSVSYERKYRTTPINQKLVELFIVLR